MNKTLKQLRTDIDQIDEELISLFAKRIDVVKKIGEVKKAMGKEIVDHERWQEVLEKIQKKAEKLKINSLFITKLYELIHHHSQEIENK